MSIRAKIVILSLSFLLAFSPAGLTLAAAAPDDSVSLAGLSSSKALFDINLSDPAKLPLYLNVIQQTYTGLEDQGVTPDFVIAFRGAAVTFVTTAADQALKDQISAMAALPNIRFEACAVATGLFGIPNDTIISDITVVGNTFISSIGFGSETKGYATIPIM